LLPTSYSQEPCCTTLHSRRRSLPPREDRIILHHLLTNGRSSVRDPRDV
jgi:hypothetical protein